MLLLAGLPFGNQIGIAVAIVGTLLVFGLFWLTTPVIEVGELLVAGRMRIPLSIVGETKELQNQELRRLIGPAADARAKLMIRGYVKTALKIELSDLQDSTPYLVISTRRPKELAVALLADRS
jgi:hypothetical protein